MYEHLDEKTVSHRGRRTSHREGTAAKRRQRRRRIPGLWVRLSALAMIVVALIVGMVGLTLKAIRPYREASAEAAHLAQTRQHAAILEAHNAALRQQIAYLQTPAGIAEEAHRLGYMYPGERPLILLGLTSPRTREDSDADNAAFIAAPSRNASFLDRFIGHLRDL